MRLKRLLVAAVILATAGANSPPDPHETPAMGSPEAFAAPADAMLEKPEAADSEKNVCADPARYPPRAFDLPQLSAVQLMALFTSPSTARELLRNIRLLAERDLLVQTAFVKDEVLRRFFGATKVTW